jgi:uncharacterized phage infection (PIP) family protein YhgE
VVVTNWFYVLCSTIKNNNEWRIQQTRAKWFLAIAVQISLKTKNAIILSLDSIFGCRISVSPLFNLGLQ